MPDEDDTEIVRQPFPSGHVLPMWPTGY